LPSLSLLNLCDTSAEVWAKLSNGRDASADTVSAELCFDT
jgi:hypothetical protein